MDDDQRLVEQFFAADPQREAESLVADPTIQWRTVKSFTQRGRTIAILQAYRAGVLIATVSAIIPRDPDDGAPAVAPAPLREAA